MNERWNKHAPQADWADFIRVVGAQSDAVLAANLRRHQGRGWNLREIHAQSTGRVKRAAARALRGDVRA